MKVTTTPELKRDAPPPATHPHLPNFAARLRAIYGRKKSKTSGTKLVGTARGER